MNKNFHYIDAKDMAEVVKNNRTPYPNQPDTLIFCDGDDDNKHAQSAGRTTRVYSQEQHGQGAVHNGHVNIACWDGRVESVLAKEYDDKGGTAKRKGIPGDKFPEFKKYWY